MSKKNGLSADAAKEPRGQVDPTILPAYGEPANRTGRPLVTICFNVSYDLGAAIEEGTCRHEGLKGSRLRPGGNAAELACGRDLKIHLVPHFASPVTMRVEIASPASAGAGFAALLAMTSKA